MKIGFKTADDGTLDSASAAIDDEILRLFQSFINPPEWQSAYEMNTFLAIVFGTYNKPWTC